MIKEQGNLTSLKVHGARQSYDPTRSNPGCPDFKQYQELRAAWDRGLNGPTTIASEIAFTRPR